MGRIKKTPSIQRTTLGLRAIFSLLAATAVFAATNSPRNAFAAPLAAKDVCQSNVGQNAEIIGVVGNQCYKAFLTHNGKTYATLGGPLSTQNIDRLNTLYPALEKCIKRCSNKAGSAKTTASATKTNNASSNKASAVASVVQNTTPTNQPQAAATAQSTGPSVQDGVSTELIINQDSGTATRIITTRQNGDKTVDRQRLEYSWSDENGKTVYGNKNEALNYVKQNSGGKEVTVQHKGEISAFKDGKLVQSEHEKYEDFIKKNKGDLAETKAPKPEDKAARKDARQAARKQKKEDKKNSDNCWESLAAAEAAGLTGKELDRFRCDPTTQIAKGVEVGNQVLQTAGATAIGLIGNTTAAKRLDGTRSSLEKGAAKAAKTARVYESNLAAANAAAAVILGVKANQHKTNAGKLAQIQKNAQSASVPQEVTADAFFSGRQDPGSSVAALHAERLQKAINEQQNARNVASAATFVAAMNAMKSGVNAGVAESTRKKAEELAAEYEKEEAALRAKNIAWVGAGPMGTQNGEEQSLAAIGEENQSSTHGIGDDETSLLPNGQDLGGGLLDGPKGPMAGAFQAGSGAGGGGSGGGGAGGLGAGGGGGGGGDAGAEDAKASYASEFGTKERYESGGGGGYAQRAGGGKGGAGKEDGGLDLNGLLAQFLPKTEEEMPNRNGILDFASGGRMPAALPNEAASYLDKNADLFQRIHETMSEKNRKGQIGG